MRVPAVLRQVALAALFAFIGIDAHAQAVQPKPAPEMATRLYRLKNADPNVIAIALEAFTRSGRAMLVPSREFRTLTISGSPEVLDAVESMIRELDVAPPQPESIEITAYLLAASVAGPAGQKLPPALDPVMKQLRSTFQYTSYLLLDTILIRNLAGRPGSTNGVVGLPEPAGQNGNYSLAYSSAEVGRDSKGVVVRIRDLRLALEMPRHTKASDGSSITTQQVAGFSTNIDAREGQMVVVGKTSFEAGDKALIAVLSARVMD